MAKREPSAAAGAGAEAIRRALEAEEQAGRDVQQAAGEAEFYLERARDRARDIAARADRRIERIVRCSGEGTAARAEAVRAQASVELARLDRPADDTAGPGCAARRVARWLVTPAGVRGDFPREPPDGRS